MILLAAGFMVCVGNGSFAQSSAQSGATAALPANGEWDGVTASAKLQGPYEDPKQMNVPFGINSFYFLPWRGYMDTWPGSKLTETCGAVWNIDDKYAEATAQILEESGIRAARVEIGWGNLDWNDDLNPNAKAFMHNLLAIFKRHGIRPLILLNANHGSPCPMRDVHVEVLEDAKKGDHVLKLKSGDGIRAHYTGIANPAYIAADPMITSVDADGTAHLSAGLPMNIKAGPLRLQELKYQPFQGTRLKDGKHVPEALQTVDGWMKYVATVGRNAREALGTEGKPDSGFDLEVWNEQTFGSYFLDINHYYDQKFQYAEPLQYNKTRPMRADYRPDARLTFQSKDCYVILPMTIDYFNDPAHGYSGVNVISGFSNQWPWESGTAMWDGEAGFSRHYYTGGWQDCSPTSPIGPAITGSIDALGNFDGKKDGKDWHTIFPGTKFIPTFRVGYPEYFHSGLKTESLSHDVVPDSRLSGWSGHGRYTNNGDFHPAQVWESEVNYFRGTFFDEIAKETGIKRGDPRMMPLDERMAGKMMLRQYVFHAHKGLYRIMIFCLKADPCSFGMLPPAYYAALDKSNGALTAEVRSTVPPEFKGLGWLTHKMSGGDQIVAPRALRVDGLVEYKPRLIFAGDGTPAHPNRWNRDQFAFLPFQLMPDRFVIPYYVVTSDVTHVWDKQKDVLDPARYDMPEQDYDVTIGNIAGHNATVSVYDPLANRDVPVKIVASTSDTLTVRLKAVDYPRVLEVTERSPGPLIVAPRVVADKDGRVTVSWQTNIPVQSVKITYGSGWVNRAATEIAIAPGKQVNSVTLPGKLKGVVAVRIRVTANGLTDAWPHWDEDPVGQVVVPGGTLGTLSAVNRPSH
jgi:hypothetical protein